MKITTLIIARISTIPFESYRPGDILFINDLEKKYLDKSINAVFALADDINIDAQTLIKMIKKFDEH